MQPLVMKALLLTYYYPPTQEVGGLRARKIADSFLQRNSSVVVVAGPSGRGDAKSSTELPGILIQRVEPSLAPRALYLRLRSRAATGTAPHRPSREAESWTPPVRARFLKRQLWSALWLPDDRQGWIRPAAARSIELVRQGVDLVYSTAPPFSVHLAALLVKRRTGVPWVAEFRDPWFGNPGKPAFTRSRWSDAAERWLERCCLVRADTVVTATESIAAMLRKRLSPEVASKIVVIRNGIDSIAPMPPSAVIGPVRRVLHLGSLYHDRDPRPFLRAVASLRCQGLIAEDLRIDFVGDNRGLLGVSMKGFLHELDLAGIVNLIDHIPHDHALTRLRDADLLLLLAQNQPVQVPNKLYEYLGARRPILAFADAHGETARMLRQLGGHFIVDAGDPRFVEDLVHAALSGNRPPSNVTAESLLQEWSAARQLDQLHAHLETVLR